jgi:hypothetical protein
LFHSSLLFPRKRKKRKETGKSKNDRWLSLRLTCGYAGLSLHWVFPGCHVQFKAVLRVVCGTLCVPFVFAVV